MPASGDFYTVPEVVLIVGDGIKRFHTLSALHHFLEEQGHYVATFVTSLTDADVDSLSTAREKQNIQVFSKGLFVKVYKELSHGTNKRSYILIECVNEEIMTYVTAKNKINVLVCTDVLSCEPGETSHISDHLSQLGQQSLQTLIYPSEVDHKEDVQFVDMSALEIKEKYSYGQSELAEIFFEMEGNNVTFLYNNEEHHLTISDFDSYSEFKQSSLCAVLTFLFTEQLTADKANYVFQDFPLAENARSLRTVLTWGSKITNPIEAKNILFHEKRPVLVVGSGLYMRFEEVIEKIIEYFRAVVVVAENDAQDILVGDYFLQKEKDAFHTILYIGDHHYARDILGSGSIIKSSPTHFVFDDVHMFTILGLM